MCVKKILHVLIKIHSRIKRQAVEEGEGVYPPLQSLHSALLLLCSHTPGPPHSMQVYLYLFGVLGCWD